MFRAEEVNTGTNESEFGCGPQDSVGKFTYICQFKRVAGNKHKKVFLKKRTHILIARDVFLALGFIVAKAPYSHESDSSISILLQLIWSNAEKYRYPNKLEKLYTLQNIANLQGFGFTLDFWFRIYRDRCGSTPLSTVLRKSVTFFILNIFLKLKTPSKLKFGNYPIWMTRKPRKGDFKE